jgi:hypothetical protein
MAILYCLDRGYAQMPRCLLGSVQMPQAKHKISEPPQSCGRIRAINFQQTHIEQRASDCGTGQAVSFEVMPFKWQSGVLYCLAQGHAFQMAAWCIVLFSSRSCFSNGRDWALVQPMSKVSPPATETEPSADRDCQPAAPVHDIFPHQKWV